MPIGIWLLDATGKIIYGNETARSIWGEVKYLAKDDFDQYQAWRVPENTLIGKDDWAAPKALQGQLTLNEKIKIKGFDGVIRYILNSAIPLKDASGKITHCLVMNQEITAQQNSEEQLATTVTQLSQKVQEAEMFKLALNQAAEHFIITDPDGIIVFANDSVETVTGYSKQEVLGTKAGKLWSKPMPPEFYQKMWHRIKNEKKTFEGEITNRRKNGQEYVALTIISPILDEHQEIKFFLAMERDISKEKQVDKAKTEFVSFASHQLRTPLTAVRWYTEMLLSDDAGALNEKQRKFVTEISDASLRMIQLVSDLLNVSRIELGTFTVRAEPVNIGELLNTALTDLTPLQQQKQIQLTNESQAVPILQLDKKLMFIVLENLVGNAMKYTPEHGSVCVELQVLQKGQTYRGHLLTEEALCFSVSDTGIGIPVDQHDKIFSKLFRADNAMMYDTSGTGLGLYISKSIITYSGGEIWFESTVNAGSTFAFWVPTQGMNSREGSKELE
jgi:PAS domain S-box-containing protein